MGDDYNTIDKSHIIEMWVKRQVMVAMEALRKRILDVDANFLEEVMVKEMGKRRKRDKEREERDGLLTSRIVEQPAGDEAKRHAMLGHLKEYAGEAEWRQETLLGTRPCM